MDARPAGLSIPEAAAALGISEKTIRRRIKAGTLNATRTLTPQGFVWMVQVDSPPPGHRDQDNDQDRGVAMQQVMDELTRTVTWPLATRLEELARENERLKIELHTAREQLALMAPRAEAETFTAVKEVEPEHSRARDEVPPLPWWHPWRWFGG